MAAPSLPDWARRTIAWGLTLGAACWTAALAGAPYGATHPANNPAMFYGGAAAYFVGGVICHQHPHRSFFLWGAQVPVCARCTGMYLGAAAGAASALAVAYWVCWRRLRDHSIESLRAWRVMLVLSAAPTALTFMLEKLVGVPFANVSRALAGVPLGFVVAWMAVSSLRGREKHAGGPPEVNCRDAIDGGTTRAC